MPATVAQIEQAVLSIVRTAERLLEALLMSIGFVFVLGVGVIWALVPWTGQPGYIVLTLGLSAAWLVLLGFVTNGLQWLVVHSAVVRFNWRFRGHERGAALQVLGRVTGPRQVADKMRVAMGAAVGPQVAPEAEIEAALEASRGRQPADIVASSAPGAHAPRVPAPRQRDIIPLELAERGKPPAASGPGRHVPLELDPPPCDRPPR